MKKILAVVIIPLTLLVLGVGIVILLGPLAFLKSLSIRPTTDIAGLINLDETNRVDIEGILSRIPYHENTYVQTLLPKDKYKKTILDGYGDCSNLSYGLAYYLNDQDIDYQLVHFLYRDGFLTGKGHVALQTSYTLNDKEFTGIVDVLEGGLPVIKGNFVNLHDLFANRVGNGSILSLSPVKDNRSKYYTHDFLDESVIGVMTGREIEDYYNFLEVIYVPLGSEQLEKYVYDGISVLAGKYPAVYVAESDYRSLFENHGAVKFISVSVLWIFRICVLLIIGALIAVGWIVISQSTRRRSTRSQFN